MKSTTISLVFALVNILAIQAFECPANETIFPCACYNNVLYGPNVDCTEANGGDGVNQNTVDSLFSALRAYNNLTVFDSLYIYRFMIRDTSLTQLDLTPLVNVRMDYLELTNNPDLVSITGRADKNHTETVNVRVMEISHSALTDEGLGVNFLRNFNSSYLASLDLSHNRLEGSPGKDFLPGLSAFAKLYRLYLNNNRIWDISGSQFKSNTMLGSINLEGNKGIRFGADAFNFDDSPGNVAHSYLVFNLTLNELTDYSFRDTSALDKIKRPISLELQWNKFESLSAANFQGFLNSSTSNMMYLEGNPFVCDSSLKWVKDGRAQWENQVRDAFCINDPGRTVFTSDLVV